jgi:hypothetical protein
MVCGEGFSGVDPGLVLSVCASIEGRRRSRATITAAPELRHCLLLSGGSIVLRGFPARGAIVTEKYLDSNNRNIDANRGIHNW